MSDGSKNNTWKYAAIAMVFLMVLLPLYLFIRSHPIAIRNPAANFATQIHVLFIGDAYTSANDMPSMLTQIAASDRVLPLGIFVETSIRSKPKWDQLWNTGDGRKKFFSRHWDFVILQGSNLWPMYNDGIRQSEDVLQVWHADILRGASRMVLFETWALQPGSGWYTPHRDGKALDFVDPNYMRLQIAGNTDRLAKLFGAIEAPVGDFWAIAYSQNPPIALYQQDGSNPNVAGSYLTALVFYRYLTGHSPRNVAFEPIGMPEGVPQRLREIASGG